nr:MAG TPA: hypothetical protein [Caudoviricetes sp.]
MIPSHIIERKIPLNLYLYSPKLDRPNRAEKSALLYWFIIYACKQILYMIRCLRTH